MPFERDANGRFLKGYKYERRPFEVRFWEKVDKNGPVPQTRPDLGQCWLWTSTATPQTQRTGGYGYIHKDGKMRSAHRCSYALAHGEIAEGKTIDHLCRNRICVNPDHLEVVTLRENLLRGEGAAAQGARATHCKNGHPLVSVGSMKHGRHKRWCRICANENRRRSYVKESKANSIGT